MPAACASGAISSHAANGFLDRRALIALAEAVGRRGRPCRSRCSRPRARDRSLCDSAPGRRTARPSVCGSPAITASASAICGTRLGFTKLATSTRRTPASTSRRISSSLVGVASTSGSLCKPSRGPTSTISMRRRHMLTVLTTSPSVTAPREALLTTRAYFASTPVRAYGSGAATRGDAVRACRVATRAGSRASAHRS